VIGEAVSCRSSRDEAAPTFRHGTLDVFPNRERCTRPFRAEPTSRWDRKPACLPTRRSEARARSCTRAISEGPGAMGSVIAGWGLLYATHGPTPHDSRCTCFYFDVRAGSGTGDSIVGAVSATQPRAGAFPARRHPPGRTDAGPGRGGCSTNDGHSQLARLGCRRGVRLLRNPGVGRMRFAGDREGPRLRRMYDLDSGVPGR